jgi:hypothetical protein
MAILVIGIVGVVLSIIIGIVVYFVVFTPEKQCLDAGNDWDSINKKCIDETKCKESDNVWDINKCRTKEYICTMGTTNTYTDGICYTPELLCAKKGNSWISETKECLSPEEKCEYDEKYWSEAGCIPYSEKCTNEGMSWVENQCQHKLEINVKGVVGAEEILVKTESDLGVKTFLELDGKLDAAGKMPKTKLTTAGISKTFYLDDTVSSFIIDFTNDNGPNDVMLTEIKLNGVDILKTVTRADRIADDPRIKEGKFLWGGEYIFPITKN